MIIYEYFFKSSKKDRYFIFLFEKKYTHHFLNGEEDR